MTLDVTGKPVDHAEEIVIAGASNRSAQAWGKKTYTVQAFIDMLSKTRVGAKDGAAIIQGSLNGPERKKQKVEKCYVMMHDFDNGVPLDTIADRYEALGLQAVIWATHSHMRPHTQVPENTLENYRRKVNATAIDVALFVRYLKDVKGYIPEVFENCELKLTRGLKDNGVEYTLRHNPLPRVRGCVFLSEPFDFINRVVDGKLITQKDALNDWAAKYMGFGALLGFKIDRSCTDASRLMYLPARPEGTDPDNYPIYLIEGKTLDIERVPGVTGNVSLGVFSDAVLEAEGLGDKTRTTFKTPGLPSFLKKNATRFQIATWAEECGAFEQRGNHVGDKLCFACPNDEHHSNAGDPDDVAFICVNADGVTGFSASCQHDTCITMSNKDRAWYLDKMCQIAGIANASELEEWVLPGDEDDEPERELDPLDPISTLCPSSTEDEVNAAMLTLIGATPLTLARGLRDISDKTGLGKREINAQFNAVRSAQAASDETEVVRNTHGPENPYDFDGPIPLSWDDAAIWRQTKITLERINRSDPNLFVTADGEGGVVLLQKNDDAPLGARLQPMRSMSQWAWYMDDKVQYFDPDDMENGRPRMLSAPTSVQSKASGCADWNFDALERIVNVPQLGPDFKILYRQGYNRAMRSYLIPNVEFAPLPSDKESDEVWANEVEAALALLLEEAVRDFPFADYNGDVALPTHVEDRDEDGYRYPNLRRGGASRTNWLAMTLQGFVRPAIKGSCPAYHIDKSAAGTGAGYLMRVTANILTGKPEPAQTVAGKEEFSKAITATLIGGAPIIFLDNLTHKMDSPDLAAALTSGSWKARILGQSEMVDIPIKALWVMAGNSTKFTEELMRRNVPIHMDAATPNPAQDRTDADFKHNPIEQWLSGARPALVRSCLILVQNWVRLGHKPGKHRLNSFTSWARTLGGIMDAADEIMQHANMADFNLGTNFLANIPDYLQGDAVDEENNVQQSQLVPFMWEKVGTNDFTPAELLAVIDAPENIGVDFGLVIRGFDDAGRIRSLGRTVSTEFLNRTFIVSRGDDEELKVRWEKTKSRTGAKHRLRPL